MAEAINIGDKVVYLGITYEVIEIDDMSIKIRRANRGTMVITVMRGSARFKAIFPKLYEKTKKTDLFNKGKEPEVVVEKSEDADRSRILTSGEPDADWLFDFESKNFKFVEKYSKRTDSVFNGTSHIIQTMVDDIMRDETGLLFYLINCWAYRNSSAKFDIDKSALAVYLYRGDRPKVYDTKLLEFFKRNLNEFDDEPTDEEYEILASLIPLKDSALCLSAFCQFNVIDEKPLLKPKEMEQVILEVGKLREGNEEPEDL